MPDFLNVMLIEVSEDSCQKKVVNLSTNGEMVAFCERWEGKGQAWVDMSSDNAKLRKMWSRCFDLPEVQMPCTVHYVVFGVYL